LSEFADKLTMKTRERQSLTTRQLAESLGVSESSVKRWIDDGTIAADRTAGGHRRIPMAAAVRFMRRHRMSPQRPEAMPLSTAPSLGAVDSEAADACYEALLSDDAERARAIIMGRYISGADIATIGDGLMRPVFVRLGELWKHDPQGILVEHRAVDTCIRALADLLAWLPTTPPDAPVSITAAGPGDPYLLPPMLASMTLQEQGYHARNLGPTTPLETIAMAAERYGTVLCSLSVSTSQDRKHHADWIRLADRLAASRTRFVVGGRCVESLPTELLGRARVCGSMVELGSYAAGVVQGVGSGHKPTRGNAP
jgi:MerR family transcriptional regulator, light-induced transcriptional regulator